MYPKKERVKALLVSAIKETELLLQMSGAIQKPDDFLTSLTGMTVYRACGMSLQFITESLVKIRNLCGQGLFKCYTSIPWNSVFGMRNFLSHEYGEVDAKRQQTGWPAERLIDQASRRRSVRPPLLPAI